MTGQGLRAFGLLGGVVAALMLMLSPAALAQNQGGGIVGAQGGPVLTACNAHGHLNFNRCFCDMGWTGSQCEKPESPPNCGAHGKTVGYSCRCEAGWKGHLCERGPPACDQGVLDHGKCVCKTGWTGAACNTRQ